MMPGTGSLLLGVMAQFFAATAWFNCPFCPPSAPPLAERVAQADAVVLVAWVSSHEASSEQEESHTEFRVVDVLKHQKGQPTRGVKIRLPFLQEGRPGDLFVLMGQQTETLFDWALPLAVSEVSYAYLKQAPPPEKPASERLPYFLKFMENPEDTIANDAFAEFSRARYEDVVALQKELSAKTIRRWIDELQPTEQLRLGFYALLLGLCGTTDDEAFLARQVLVATPPDQVRLGLDGMMGGYVLLTGAAGLDRLIEARLDRPDQPDGDIYAFINTLRFLWQYPPAGLPKSKIETTVTRLLDRPAFAEVAIHDLARWNHWGVTDRVLGLYGQFPFDDTTSKTKIINFALARVQAARKNPVAEGTGLQAAEAFLAHLEKTEPQVLRAAKRFYNPGSSGDEKLR